MERMSLTFGFSSVRDLFEKLKRDAEALDREFSSDGLFNFVITGYSMIDWIRKDPSVPASARSVASSLYDMQWLKICGDLATGCKHFTLTKRTPMVSSAPAATGFGVGRFGKGAWGVGEESVSIQLNDGTSYSGLQLVEGV